MSKFICPLCGLVQDENTADVTVERYECGDCQGVDCYSEYQVYECCECGCGLNDYYGELKSGEFENEEVL